MSLQAARGSLVFVAVPLLLLGAVATAMALYGTARYGTGISPDSLSYLSAAKNLLLGNGFKIYNQELYLSWPPLFPIILALTGSAGIDITYGARLINAVGFGSIVMLAGWLLLNTTRSKPLVFLALLSILFSSPLLSVSVMAWTETGYTVLSMAFFLVLLACLRSGSRVQLMLCAVVAALASLQRYVGITLVITGAAAVTFFSHGLSRRKRIIHLLSFSLVSITPLLLWLLRNYLISGTAAGFRYPAYYGLLKNISLTSGTLGVWLLPLFFSALLRHLVVIALAVLVIHTHLMPPISGAPQEHTIRQQWLSLITLYCIAYAVFVIAISSLKAFEPIGDRFLAPLYPLVMLLVFTAFDDWCQRPTRSRSKQQWITGITAGILSVWLIYPVSQTVSALSAWRKEGAGEDFFGRSYYGKRAWQESTLAAWLRTHPPGGTVYSNEPLALYTLTGIVARVSPLKHDAPEQFSSESPLAQESLLVWFNDQFEGQSRFMGKGDQVYPVSELRKFFDLEVLQSFADGVLYRFTINGNVGSEITLQ